MNKYIFVPFTGGTAFTLPKNLKLADGSTVANAPSLSDADLEALGVYKVIETPRQAWEVLDTYTTAGGVATEVSATIPLEEYKVRKVSALYEDKNRQLDALVEGYSQLEIATWPAIQADILQYGIDSSVGVAMQQAIDTSGYDAPSLEALLLPRIQAQATIYTARKAEATAIMAAGTHLEV